MLHRVAVRRLGNTGRPKRVFTRDPASIRRFALAHVSSEAAHAFDKSPHVTKWGQRRVKWVQNRTYASAAAAASQDVQPIAIAMPALSPTMSKGKISKWNLQEGDELTPGQVLCEIETDKATVDFENQDEGYLAKIILPEGSEDVSVGAKIAYMTETKEEAERIGKMDLSELSGGPSSAPAQEEKTQSASGASSSVNTSHTHIDLDASQVMPSARHLMAAKGVDSSNVQGSGKGGRILKGDVIKYLEDKSSSPKSQTKSSQDVSQKSNIDDTSKQSGKSGAEPAAPTTNTLTTDTPRGKYRDEKASGVRKVIAQRLTESKANNPHLYLIMDCQTDELIALRKSLKKSGVNVSMNDMVIKAVAKALKDVPQANVTFNRKSGEIEPCSSVDISVAVATEGGLITPIVKDADKRGLLDINADVKDLAKRARAGKLQPEEYQGGSFTISNLGMFGIDEFTAVINPPQGCILAVGQGQRHLRSLDDGGEPEAATIMSVQLSVDRRAVDEMGSSQFLQVFQKYIEKPHLLVT